MKLKTYWPIENRSLLKRRASFALPYIIYAFGLFFISLFVFEVFIKGSSLWGFVFAEVPAAEAVDNGIDYIGVEKLERITEPKEANDEQTVPDVVVSTDTFEEAFDYIPTLPELREGCYIPRSSVSGYPLGSYWATISVEDDERIDEVPVYQGDNTTLLSMGVGHLYGSCFPGEGGVCVLAAHVSGKADYFTNLAEQTIYKEGTQIKLDTAYGVYVYEVVFTEILDHKNTKYAKRYIWSDGGLVDMYSALTAQFETDELLVMYTCYPKGLGFRTQRYYVICRRIYGYSWR